MAWAVILMIFLYFDWAIARVLWVAIGAVITLWWLYIRIFERDLFYMSFILGWFALIWYGTYRF